MSVDSSVIIIGGGMSGIGAAVQLVRNFNTIDFEIIEKSGDVGGTWHLNTYPGCGCDVASHFYSYSFALNPEWSKVFAMQPEIHKYFKSVAEDYNITSRVRCHSVVESAHWDPDTATWLVRVLDLQTNQVRNKRCNILISAVGALSIPQVCDIPGVERFRGKLFHSAEWDHSFDWKGKDVVAIGNGCSATQFVPAMSTGDGAVRKMTQFSRQAHWLAKRENPDYSSRFKFIMRWVPFAMRLYRWWIYWNKEMLFRGFSIETGEKIRQKWAKEAADYIRSTAPAKYRDVLVPNSVIGCKRRVNDTGYLSCLHQPNVELIHDDPIRNINEDGVITESGRFVRADAIVLATGFQTHKFLFPMDIRGKGGISLQQHWDQMNRASSCAYFGTCMSGFPNFFTLMGPNTVTGHLSVVYTVECQINFIIKVIKPIMASLGNLREPFSTRKPGYDTVEVVPEAELSDNRWIQKKCKELVWSTGCTSWFIDTKTGINTQMYPDWQFLFWARSYFVRWKDLAYTASPRFAAANQKRLIARRSSPWFAFIVGGLLATGILAVVRSL